MDEPPTPDATGAGGRKEPSRAGWFVAIVLAAIIGLAVGVVAGRMSSNGGATSASSTPTRVTMPDVHGYTAEAAIVKVVADGFCIAHLNSKVDRAKVGTVINQSPSAGSQAQPRSGVTLVYASRPLAPTAGSGEAFRQGQYQYRLMSFAGHIHQATTQCHGNIDGSIDTSRKWPGPSRDGSSPSP